LLVDEPLTLLWVRYVAVGDQEVACYR